MVATKRLLPIAADLNGYKGRLLAGDVAAAITVWAIVVPESVAYAAIAGMPPEVGLYVATVPLVVYALLGTSRRMAVGPSATAAAVSAAAVAPLATNPEDFVQLTVALSMVVGAVLLVARIARLGMIAEFLSEPVLKGFLVGVAITIIGGQLAKVFGVEAEGEGFIEEMVDLLRHLGDVHRATLVVGATALVALLLLHRLLPRIPASLVVVAGGILAANAFDLEERGVHLVGEISAGLPTLGVPDVTWTQVANLVPAAIGVSIVVFGESMALAKSFGAKHGERVDANVELGALGAANAVNGLFGGFAATGSSSRTAAADESGQHTQVASLICGALLVVTMLFLTPLFEDLPEAVLGAIVIHAVLGLIRIRPISTLRHQSSTDFAAAVTTLAGVILFDILAGLIIGVAVSIVGMMRRAIRPRCIQLGLDADTGTYESLDDDGVAPVSNVVIMRFEAELFFANASVLRETVLATVDSLNPQVVVLDAESITNVDTTGAQALGSLIAELESRDVQFMVARLETPVLDTLLRCGVDLSGKTHRRVKDAVGAISQ
jgi:SulP family sulfate permease